VNETNVSNPSSFCPVLINIDVHIHYCYFSFAHTPPGYGLVSVSPQEFSGNSLHNPKVGPTSPAVQISPLLITSVLKLRKLLEFFSARN
jgi:hypothetical protein